MHSMDIMPSSSCPPAGLVTRQTMFAMPRAGQLSTKTSHWRSAQALRLALKRSFANGYEPSLSTRAATMPAVCAFEQPS
jgi:hypothetical protein